MSGLFDYRVETADCVGTASFSPCMKYRYTLSRTWPSNSLKMAVFIGLNPSTADAEKNDPTIRRDIAFAKRLGCGRMVKLNLFGWRDTDPNGLLVPSDPVGEHNDIQALGACTYAGATVIACWGSHRKSKRLALLVATRAAMFRTMMSLNGVSLNCFGVNADGQPKHTLYLPGNAALVGFR